MKAFDNLEMVFIRSFILYFLKIKICIHFIGIFIIVLTVCYTHIRNYKRTSLQVLIFGSSMLCKWSLLCLVSFCTRWLVFASYYVITCNTPARCHLTIIAVPHFPVYALTMVIPHNVAWHICNSAYCRICVHSSFA